MTALRRFIVRRSNFPFSIPGQPIGHVDARDRRHAEQLAAAQFTGALTVELEHDTSKLEGALEKALRSKARKDRRGPHVHHRIARKPMGGSDLEDVGA